MEACLSAHFVSRTLRSTGFDASGPYLAVGSAPRCGSVTGLMDLTVGVVA
jgi:hypothetical protein